MSLRRKLSSKITLWGLVLLFLSTPLFLQAQDFTPAAYVAWHPDGTMLAVGSGTTLQIHNATTMQVLNTFTGLQDQVCAPSWSPDGTRLAIANGSAVQVWQQPWDANTAQLVTTFQSSSYVRSLAWSPNGDRVAVAQDDVEVWDVATGQLLYRESEHRNFIFQIAWNPDGTQLATASVDNSVKIWSAATGEVLSTMWVITDTGSMPVSEAYVSADSVSWNPDGTKLVFGAEDGSVRIWDRTVLSGAEVSTVWGDPTVLQEHEEAVWAVAWSPTGDLIASGSLDGTVRFWNATTGEQIEVIQVGTNVQVNSVAWSPDGSKLAYGEVDGTVGIVPAPGATVATATPTLPPT